MQTARVFFVDGYGRDFGMVAFTRAPGNDPQAEWRVPRPAGGAPGRAPLAGLVPSAIWDELVERGLLFDRTLAPQPRPDTAIPPAPCLHGWQVYIETVAGDGSTRSAGQNACDDGLAVAYGFHLAKLAVEALPYCVLLDPNKTRNDVTRLGECSALSGDRAAAAQAYTAYRTTWFGNPRGPDFARALQHLFFDQADLAWPGLPPVKGSEAASRIWTTHAGSAGLYVRRIFGETADRVLIDFDIVPNQRNDGAATMTFPATMLWTRENGFGFRLRSLTLKDGAGSKP